jgi:hypothetical protein
MITEKKYKERKEHPLCSRESFYHKQASERVDFAQTLCYAVLMNLWMVRDEKN